jgi:hypothetical protein
MKRPIFVVGCPRSGTTLVYSMLVGAGGVAVYRKETYFYDLVHRFPSLATERAQRQFGRAFMSGYLGKVPGLDVEPLIGDALRRCTTPGEFLPLLMESIAAVQQMDRWVEGTPAHVLYMKRITRDVPDALFVHVIRDGRDCALSNLGYDWTPALPWDKGRRLGVAALFWEWMVRSGRAYGRRHPDRYLDVRFEDLIANPRGELERIGTFVEHDLDYDRIRQNRVHAMQTPETSFPEELKSATFNPVGRWKTRCSPDDIRLCESLIGGYLQELGYPLAHGRDAARRSGRAHMMRAVYLSYFALKHRLKAHTPLGRVMTSTAVWTEQPRPDERPVRPFPASPITPLGAVDGEMATR